MIVLVFWEFNDIIKYIMYLVFYLVYFEMEVNKYSNNFLREKCEGYK